MRVLVTGGAGYLGSTVAQTLLARGHEVRILDVLLHDNEGTLERVLAAGATAVVGDVRDAARRAEALDEIDAVVHLAAIVGDPACRDHPELSDEVNIDASRALADEVAAAGIERLIFASTCSNYGIVEESVGAVDEDAPLAPVSRYARQKVEVERYLLEQLAGDRTSISCLRFATLYGASARMRFDLLVNEFARDMWAGRSVQVYKGNTWRPYVHVADAAHVVAAALAREQRGGERLVANVGSDDANYRKSEVATLVAQAVGSGTFEATDVGGDDRSYRVSFERVRTQLGFEPSWTIERGVAEILALLESGTLPDPFGREHVNA